MFAKTGVMAAFATALADAGIELLAQSTYNTDYILIKLEKLDAARGALAASGWTFES